MTTLSAVEVAERIAARPDGWVDLRGVEIEDVDFGHAHSATRLERFDFRGATLTRCTFTNASLRDVKFQEARLIDCDLRYTEFERTSFKRASLTGCDLYRSRLGANTIFESSDISACSLHLAVFDGVALPRSAVEEGQRRGLLQEREDDFAAFHADLIARGRGDDPTRTRLHLSRRHREAADIYRALSAHWASNGSTRDAGWAYYHARRLETLAVRPDHLWRRRRIERDQSALTRPGLALGSWRWLLGTSAGLIAGFGESPMRVILTTLAVMLAFAGLFALTDVAGQAADPAWLKLTDAVLFSAQAMTASLDANLHRRWVMWAATLETTLGITLLGLLGFCLGNRLRSA
ncbi:pentapeptide repeat-containing protein [Salinicola halophilus]|uniref:pentapeptide repeat-containing protein n=1 Tax=Salinicola halophilus TaxID=184065 RepID=UPI000DA2047D|nr:pentapeptide repeat-containing protein [Salinicola halophilus]